MSLRKTGLLLAPLAALALASCGSSGSLTMSQFISEANAICTSSSASSAAVPQPSVSSLVSPTSSDLPAIASYLNKQVTVLESTVSRLKAMGNPPSKQSSWTQGIAAVQQSADDAKAAQSAAQSSNQAAYVQALGRIVSDGNGIDSAFAAFGATACTSGTGSPSPSPKH